jgi:hypothetical protein
MAHVQCVKCGGTYRWTGESQQASLYCVFCRQQPAQPLPRVAYAAWQAPAGWLEDQYCALAAMSAAKKAKR